MAKLSLAMWMSVVCLVASGAPSVAAAAAAAPAAASAQATDGLVCKVATSGKFVHIQAVNNGAAVVPKGTKFAFVIVGPTKKTSETWTFKSDLAVGKSVDITKAIKAASVASCTPAA